MLCLNDNIIVDRGIFIIILVRLLFLSLVNTRRELDDLSYTI